MGILRTSTSGRGLPRWVAVMLAVSVGPVLLAAVMAGPVAAQDGGTLRIRVVEEGTGSPVAGAVVHVDGVEPRGATDTLGLLVLTGVVPGTRTLRVSRIGYAEALRSAAVRPGAMTSVEIRLVSRAVILPGLTVLAETRVQREAREVRQSPFAVTVIDGQRLAGRGLSLDEAVQRVTGVQVRRSGGLGSASVFNVRGLEGQRVQVYVDGNATNVVGDAFSLNDLPVQVIERVEVYKGVVPARFGGDGLGAAINLVTIDPPGGYVDAGYTMGSYGLHQFSGLARRPLGGGLTLAGTLNVDRATNDYEMESPFLPGLEIRRDHDRFRRVFAGAVLEYDRTWFDELELALVTIDSRREIQGIQTNIQHAESGSRLRAAVLEGDRESGPGGRLDLRAALVALESRGVLVDTSSVRYTFAGESYPSPNGRGELGLLPSAADNRTLLFRHRAAATWRFSASHTGNLTWVLDHTRHEPRDTLANRYAGRNVSEFPGRQASAVVGVSHEWRPAEARLVNIVGVRGYAFRAEGTPSNLTDPSLERPPPVTNRTVSVGASQATRYFLTREALLKGSIELARRLPSSTELFGDGLLVLASPALRPERSLNLSAGAQYERQGAGAGQLSLEANVFWMRLDDMIRLAQGGFAGVASHVNMGRVRIAGFDVEARADLTGWLYASAAMTLQDARDVRAFTPGTSVPNPTRGLRVPNLPWLFGHANLEAHRAHLFGRDNDSRLFYEAAYTEEYFYAFEVSRNQERRIPRSVTHTLGIEHRWDTRGVTMSAEVQNLTDARVPNQFNQPLPGRLLRLKVRYTRIPGIGDAIDHLRKDD